MLSPTQFAVLHLLSPWEPQGSTGVYLGGGAAGAFAAKEDLSGPSSHCWHRVVMLSREWHEENTMKKA